MGIGPRPAWRRVILPAAILYSTWAWPGSGEAAPGQASRLGGAEPQGPATRAITALYHNPAMLAAMQASAAHVSITGGLDQLWVRRNRISPETGEPTDELARRQGLANPMVGYFAGASLYADPFALGIGIYDLSSRFRTRSSEALSYHMARDPDFGDEQLRASDRFGGCILAQESRCPPNGGAIEYRHDLSAAVAWNAGALRLGLAVNMPTVRNRFAFDNDTSLASPDEFDGPSCDSREDPACAERVGFKGSNRWLPHGEIESGFDLALTLGVAYVLANERITLGARYRTPPLRQRGYLTLSGVALVCRPHPQTGDDALGGVPACDQTDTITATLRERAPQELALGGSFVLGRSKLWRVDTNLYWIDFCFGGVAPARCDDDGSQTLTLIGLDADSFVLPEFRRYRGRQDMYGLDAYLTYRARSNVAVTTAGHLSSPAVRRGAITAAANDGWRLGVTAGATIRLRHSALLLIPGYGLDVFLPVRVRPEDALFTPSAHTALEDAGGDINAPGADAVLEGRARPTNAGRYFGLVHSLSLAFRWQERGGRLE